MQQQRGHQRLRHHLPAPEQAGEEDDLDLRRREQGLREDGPGRRDRGRSSTRRARSPSACARAAPACPRSSRRRDTARSIAGEQGSPLVRRPAPRARRRRCAPTTRSSRPGRATPRATWCSAAPRATSRPMMAMAARITIAEVEELVPVGALDPDAVVTPGIFVQRALPGHGLREAHREAHGARRRGERRPTQARAHRAARRPRDEGRRTT